MVSTPRIFFVFLTVAFCLSKCVSQQVSSSALQSLADSATKNFSWDIQNFPKGSMMFLDVPYPMSNRTDYLTLSVGKAKKSERPDFISAIFPSSVDKQQGFFLSFSKTVMKDGKWSMEPVKGLIVRLNFDTCDSSTCRTRMFYGFAREKEKSDSVDVFKNFLEYDHALFMIFEHGEHKTVMVPLFSFKEQYKKLE